MMSSEFSKYISIWENRVTDAGYGEYIEGIKYFVCHEDFPNLAHNFINNGKFLKLPPMPFPKTGIVLKHNGMVVVLSLWFAEDGLHVNGAVGDRNAVSLLPRAVLNAEEKKFFIDHSMGEEAVKLMQGLTYSAIGCINQVNESGGTAYMSTPHKSNARRKAKGKRPLLVWTTINLDASRYKSEPKGGTHASPRLHDRRGHWVTSKLGKKFWRKDSKVGSAKNGITIQSYEKGNTQ
jgi:hypothetical protein